MDQSYYQPSGKAPVSGIIISMLGGAASAIALGIAYIALQWFIPIIYLNILICMGMSFGIALVVNFLIKKTKIRNKGMAMVIALVAALVGLYAQWALFVSLMMNAEGGDLFVRSSFSLDTFISVALNPKFVFQSMQDLNEVGTFSLKKDIVSGTFLWIIWALEAIIIISLPVLLAPIQAGKPFSETNNDWMEEADGKDRPLQYITDIPTFKSSLEAGNYHILDTLKQGNISPTSYCKATLYSLAGDNDSYITLDNITITTNSKGKQESSAKNVIKYKAIPSSIASKFI